MIPPFFLWCWVSHPPLQSCLLTSEVSTDYFSLHHHYGAAADSEQFTGVKVLWFTIGLHIHCYLGLSKDGGCSDLPCLWWANQGEQEETVTALWMQVNIILAANSHWAFYQLKPQTLFSLLSHVPFTLFLCCYVFRSKSDLPTYCYYYYYLLLFVESLLYTEGRHFRYMHILMSFIKYLYSLLKLGWT